MWRRALFEKIKYVALGVNIKERKLTLSNYV